MKQFVNTMQPPLKRQICYFAVETFRWSHSFSNWILHIQAVRNESDLDFLTCPPKYRRVGDFKKYIDGTSVAPLLTIVIGGNHEVSNVLRELWVVPSSNDEMFTIHRYYGGWLAPNVFYLGQSGVVRVGTSDGWIRVGGLSGIFKRHDYNRGVYCLLYGGDKIH